MNSNEKPKKIKLWKKKKSPVSHDEANQNSHKNKAKKKRPGLVQTTGNETGVIDFMNVHSGPKKARRGAGKNFNRKRKEQGTDGPQTKQKRKAESQDQTPNKKFKPDFKSKEWKILRGNKKQKTDGETKEGKTGNKKQKAKTVTKSDAETKSVNPAADKTHKTGKEWKLIHMQKKGKVETFEAGKVLKSLWEDLRRENCLPEKKSKLLKQACDILKGRVKEFTFAHDTVRVLECILSEGAENHRALLFNELKSDILPLTKAKYGKFFVLKMLKYGSKQQKDEIMKSFHGKVIKLIRHTEAAEVVEAAFNECANATQRFELVQEFYGPTYKYFKTSDVHNLGEIFEKEPSKKAAIIQHMKETLMKVLEKSVIKHSIVHHVLLQFMVYSDPTSKSEIIESMRDVVPEILHTKDGSRAAMHCVWYGNIKDRKVIVKSMKMFVAKIAKEEHGHLVLLALFDHIDDTKLLSKYIIKHLIDNMLELSQDLHGKKVLVYLLNPRDPHYVHPDVINILKAGEDNTVSKKDKEIRQSELKAFISQPLLDLIKNNIANLYTNHAFCLFTTTVLKHVDGNRREALQAIAQLVVEPYTSENKNTHAVEHPGSSFMFKQLLIQDKDPSKVDVTFSEVLIETLPKLVFKSWIDCNRGAFLLVSMLETELPQVQERIKEDLSGCKKYLTKKSYRGAEILLSKLKISKNEDV